MPAETRGSIYSTRTAGYGIRWLEGGKRPQQSGFATKTEARRWFAANGAPRLQTGAPGPRITFDEFCELFLERHGTTVSAATRRTLTTRLAAARDHFGAWKLSELEGATNEIAAWQATLGAGERYRKTKALRQALAAAVRWRYLATNPAVKAGRNTAPRAEELRPFTRAEVDALATELGSTYGPLVVFAAETGLRTNEWAALERRDLDKPARAVTVQRRVSDGVLTGYPKTERSRRRVPLTTRALAAVEALPARIDTPLLFPGTGGHYIMLDYWRKHDWYPTRRRRDRAARALLAAPHLRQRGAGRWRLDLRAQPGDGHERRDDRPHLRAPCERQRRPDPGTARGAFWR